MHNASVKANHFHFFIFQIISEHICFWSTQTDGYYSFVCLEMMKLNFRSVASYYCRNCFYNYVMFCYRIWQENIIDLSEVSIITINSSSIPGLSFKLPDTLLVFKRLISDPLIKIFLRWSIKVRSLRTVRALSGIVVIN